MKFYPLKNWRKGQDTIVINKGKYYTLEGATTWELDQKEEEKVTLATYEGEQWLKKWGGIPPVVAGKSQKDKTWIHNMLTDIDTTAVVSSHPEVMIVAPTPSGHQDAGTIILDPVARKQDENKKRRDKGKGKLFRTSPPVTRSRKRVRQESLGEQLQRSASQDSCSPRDPHQSPTYLAGTQDRHLGLDDPATPVKNNPFRPSEGYTPLGGHTAIRHTETETGLIGTTLFKKLLEKLPDFPRSSRRAIWGLVELVREGALEPSLEKLRESNPITMEKAMLACLTDDREDLTLDSKASRGDVLKIRDEISVQYQVVAKNLARIGKLKEDSIKLFEAQQKETREARREEKEILGAAMADVKTLNTLLREKNLNNNPTPGLTKALQAINDKLDRVEEHWNGLMSHI